MTKHFKEGVGMKKYRGKTYSRKILSWFQLGHKTSNDPHDGDFSCFPLTIGIDERSNFIICGTFVVFGVFHSLDELSIPSHVIPGSQTSLVTEQLVPQKVRDENSRYSPD